MSITVVAFIKPVPSEHAAVKAALLQNIPKVHDEDEGCELYALHETEDSFMMVEKWAGEEALAAHGGGGNFKDLSAALEGKLTGPIEVIVGHGVPVGDPVKGAV